MPWISLRTNELETGIAKIMVESARKKGALWIFGFQNVWARGGKCLSTRDGSHCERPRTTRRE